MPDAMKRLLIIAVSFWCSERLSAQAILAPAFGLQWEDRPDKVLDWAEEKKLDVNIQLPGAQPAVQSIRVTSKNGPLPGHQAYALEARYHWGKLFEVTLHYGAPGMKPVEVKNAFDRLKTAMTNKHGVLTPNNKQENKEDGFIRRSVSYHVEPVSGLLLLMALTEVEDLLRKKKSVRFSLLYRNQNIIPKG